jgi:replication factor A1
VVDGYVREREGDLELHVGDHGAIDEIDETVEFTPEADAIDAVEMDQVVDLAGVVRSADPKRTFDRDDGSEGQVRNVRVQDDTGDIRVALWGEKADTDLDLADYVVFTDVEIKDGWQEDLEASAGWRSTVTVMDDAPEDAAGTDADDDGTSSRAQGLGAFEDGASPDPNSSASDAGASGGGVSESDDSADGAVEEFTGTVVQAGSPVVLDDGTETRSVETTESLQLGAEVTVRGPVRDGRIEAREVESITR